MHLHVHVILISTCPFPYLHPNSTIHIGQLGKFRANTNTVTHISSSDIAEAGWGEESKKSRDLMLILMRVTLIPGHNKITVNGEVSKVNYCPVNYRRLVIKVYMENTV